MLIKQLEKEELKAARKLRCIQDQIRSHKLRMIAQKHGVEEGSIVRVNDREYLVEHISTDNMEEISMKGFPSKKHGGTFSKVTSYMGTAFIPWTVSVR